MASFEVRWKTSAKKELRRIDRLAFPTLIEIVDKLTEEPLPVGVRKLQGSPDCYRIRVGDYRAVYRFQSKDRIVEIIRVRHRREAYR